MGGQVGDRGVITRQDGTSIDVIDTIKRGSTFFLKLGDQHKPTGVSPVGVAPPFAHVGERVTVKVEKQRRGAIERHHTVTHLLHWALHEIVSREATQKGSYVGPEKLTFDFSSAALTKAQVREVEKLVNEKIAEDAPVSWREIPYAEAKGRDDIMQFFGDKYGDLVRVVQIGGAPDELNGYSMELCGGTHVRATGGIAHFRIVSESAIAAGIRRIEAVAGDAAMEWAKVEVRRQEEKFDGLTKRKNDLAPLPKFDESSAATMSASIDARAAHLEKIENEVHAWEKANAKSAGAETQRRGAEIARELLEANAGASYLVEKIPDADGALLQAITDALKAKFAGPIFLAGSSDGRVDLVAAVPKELTGKYQAGALIQKVAPIVGGKGGGRPDNARGAGRDGSKIDEALALARTLLG
jgi:alanyl-tRNA synthetase